MAANADGNGSNNQDKRVATSRDATTTPDQELHEKIASERTYANLLTQAIGAALEERSRLESVIVSGMQQQGELYDRLFSLHRQVAVASAKRSVAPSQQADEGTTHSKANGEVPPARAIDGPPTSAPGLHRDPHEAQAQGTAASPAFELTSPSITHRVALSDQAQDVSPQVQTATKGRKKDKEVDAALAFEGGAAVPSSAVTKRASRSPTMERHPRVLEADGAHSAANASTVGQQLELNSIEQVIERKEGKRATQVKRRRTAPQEEDASQPRTILAPAPGANHVMSDEVFTASQNEGKLIVPAEVEDRYIRVGSKFYYPQNTKVLAFEDKGNKLETRSNSEQIAEAMVTIARARGWDEIRVSGSETFRRQAWLEAATHGMQVKGYKPSAVDKAELAKRGRDLDVTLGTPDSQMRERAHQPDDVQTSNAVPPETAMLRKAHAIEQKEVVGTTEVPSERQPTSEDRQRAQAFAHKSAAEAIADHPELAGAYAALASMQKKITADGLSAQERAVAMARIEANLVNSIERGQLPALKIRQQVDVQRDPTETREMTR